MAVHLAGRHLLPIKREKQKKKRVGKKGEKQVNSVERWCDFFQPGVTD